ncbi:hypothetical protein BDD43_4233 [Mucilaginibacter gracilis]|uniref:GLAA-B beta-barrel domain-containing protein n=1 Tax=Mucilaginibacter gracilis TaxID=423350 RepID=A0A495J4W3_9SPHI|nr:hypothetical protein [Mucilaginibacter gracilis]RKR84015.1 hypothetical protein BDD43_4233 [Mucilaginibacter gracilis]
MVKNKLKRKPFLLFLMMVLLNQAFSQETVYVTAFGAIPDSRQDVTPALNRVLAYCKGKARVTIQFPKGRFDFYPEVGHKKSNPIGINLFKQHGLTIDGGGSEFIFHGKMQVANVDSSSDIVLRNFSVDWDRPLISQCQVVAVTDTCLDVKIDRQVYPYVIEQDTIQFIGEGWKYPVLEMYSTLYDKDTKEVVYNTWDAPLGNIFQSKAEQLAGGVVRFHGKPKMKPEVFSDKVDQPVAVRYAWSFSPDVTLYNDDGLPAAPFRTDDW